ncbi:hypothetical protein [Georgenia sp. SUBG003]|uniref:hypothetical protein n=1 Tax=Georgenia sp. SUBG003 TaxID=1497974 RepID=UPI003AB5AAE5
MTVPWRVTTSPAYASGQLSGPYGQSQPGYAGQQPAYGQSQPGYAGQQPAYGQPPGYAYGGAPVAPPAQQAYTQRKASVGEAFRYAWQGFKANAGPWIVAALVLLVVSGIGSSIEQSIV